jgi:hypothetical protein
MFSTLSDRRGFFLKFYFEKVKDMEDEVYDKYDDYSCTLELRDEDDMEDYKYKQKVSETVECFPVLFHEF